MKKLISSLWFDWFVLTLVYVITSIGAGEISSPFYIFNPLLGLFVPIGPWNLLAMFQTSGPSTLPATSDAWIYVLPLLILVLFLGNIFGKKYILNFWIRLSFNLIILFLITIYVDVTIWHQWKSWQLFSQSIFDVSKGKIDMSIYWKQ